jgi:hypothetical protein
VCLDFLEVAVPSAKSLIRVFVEEAPNEVACVARDKWGDSECEMTGGA